MILLRFARKQSVRGRMILLREDAKATRAEMEARLQGGLPTLRALAEREATR